MEQRRPIDVCFQMAIGNISEVCKRCKGCTKWIKDIIPGGTLDGITEEMVEGMCVVGRKKKNKSPSGGNSGNRTSAGLANWYRDTVPKCSVCGKINLVTLERRGAGICRQCEKKTCGA